MEPLLSVKFIYQNEKVKVSIEVREKCDRKPSGEGTRGSVYEMPQTGEGKGTESTQAPRAVLHP